MAFSLCRPDYSQDSPPSTDGAVWGRWGEGCAGWVRGCLSASQWQWHEGMPSAQSPSPTFEGLWGLCGVAPAEPSVQVLRPLSLSQQPPFCCNFGNRTSHLPYFCQALRYSHRRLLGGWG